MAWIDDLDDASFRGVSFQVQKLRLRGGRRLANHQYPLRDKPNSEDMGAKQKQFSFDAYIIGTDGVFDARDKLITALNTSGSGLLIHPTYGQMKVMAEDWTLSEDLVDEQNICRFQLSFLESGDDVSTTPKADSAQAVQTAANNATSVNGAESANAIAQNNATTSRLQQVKATISAFENDVVDALSTLSQVVAVIDFATSVAAALTSTGAVTISAVPGLSIPAKISAAEASLATLASSPATMASTMIGLVQSLGSTNVDYRQLADTFSAQTWSHPILSADMNSARISANRAVLQTMLTNQALIEAAIAASTASFDSQDAAKSLGIDLANRFDAAIKATSSRLMRTSLRSLATAVATDIANRAAALDTLMSWSNPGDAPALVLASRIYDDPAMAADIVARNAVANPLFVPAQTLTLMTPEAAA